MSKRDLTTLRARYCTCRYVGLGGNDPDGYIKRDEWCPVHGRDPDYERDKAMDDASERDAQDQLARDND